ncbi:MAG: addiction module toxin, HicA family [Verrucomicrobia bacterium]|nr:addiction module toxin, HicA family [Verrucomicrobiota bacterium]
MKLPRDLSGQELAKILCRRWDYRIVHQIGSHIILQTETPSHHRISVPAHATLRIGTLNAIVRSVSTHKSVGRDQLLESLT